MRFRLLGPLEVRGPDGAAVSVGGPRVRALLALLLLDAGRLVTAERLIDGLYGEDPPEGAANALQSQVSRLRRGLAGVAAVEFHPAGYRLAIDPGDVDAHMFEKLARDGQRALAEGDAARAAGLLGSALDLWRGRALADVPLAAASSIAARLDEARLAAIEDRAAARLAMGELRTAAAELREVVAEHPLRERARGLLMRALAGSGRAAEALAEFEEARRLLAEELGADPSPELAEVHLAILRAEPATDRAAAAAPLAAQLTSFVGREDELERVGKLLSTGRLVTLIGPGGTGKTRLAIEAGGRENGEVHFVELAPLSAGSEIPQTLLGALGLRESGLLSPAAPGPGPLDRLVAALADRPVLLILDNCEHIIHDVAGITHRLLGACRRLRVLTTSREPLGITGELLCPVPRLALPPVGTAAVEAAGYPAIRLFVDRAAAVRADFAADTADIEEIRRICAALDGLPLAIELAAARLRSLSVEEIGARLDDRFGLLSRGDRTAAPRHQTLRAVVEWSWDLLSEPERMLARRLTVFAGGATSAAAGRVCGPAADIDDLLADLVDKSLIEAGDGRYRMLETVRAFCAERLAAAGEEERLRRAHAEYFVELAETADPHLRGAEQLRWLGALAAEHGNLQAALRWAARTDPAVGLRLVATLSWFWWLRGLRAESAPAAAELLTRFFPDGAEPPAELVEEYVICVAHATQRGKPTRSLRAHWDRAVSIMNRLDLAPRRVVTGIIWGLAAGPPDPEQLTEERTRQMLGTDPWSSALAQLSMGLVGYLRGSPATAEPELAAALDGFRALGDRWGTVQALDTLALFAEWRGDWAGSLALRAEALTPSNSSARWRIRPICCAGGRIAWRRPVIRRRPVPTTSAPSNSAA